MAALPSLFHSGITMSSITIYQEICPLCHELLDNTADRVIVRQKGAEGINSASAQIHVSSGDKVHSACRKRYTNKNIIKNTQEVSSEPASRSARMSSCPFNSQTDCLFCGTSVSKQQDDFSHVKTDIFVKTILEFCENRSDEWAIAVIGRIEYYGCYLHAADCVYHQRCSVNFRTGFQMPEQYDNLPELKRRKAWSTETG